MHVRRNTYLRILWRGTDLPLGCFHQLISFTRNVYHYTCKYCFNNCFRMSVLSIDSFCSKCVTWSCEHGLNVFSRENFVSHWITIYATMQACHARTNYNTNLGSMRLTSWSVFCFSPFNSAVRRLTVNSRFSVYFSSLFNTLSTISSFLNELWENEGHYESSIKYFTLQLGI